MKQTTYFKPRSAAEAIALFNSDANDSVYIAGGTDVMVNRTHGNETSTRLIDLQSISELKGITRREDGISIGSLTTLEEIQNDRTIASLIPSLAQAARAVASPVLRKTATLGGNILCENRCLFYNQSEFWREAVGLCLKCEGDVCIATGGKKACFSKFVSDTAPVLIALNAKVEIETTHGKSTKPLEELYTGNGIQPRTILRGELITQIFIPAPENVKCVFRKLRPRLSVDFTSLTSAVALYPQGRIKIALGGVDPRPVVGENDSYHASELRAGIIKSARIVDNDLYSRKYRKEMIEVFINSAYRELGIALI